MNPLIFSLISLVLVAISANFLSLIKNDMKLNFGENIVLQASAGVSLMLIVFVMADYVFKIMPKNAINKQINGV